MFVFGTGGTGPRPESYREDVELAEQFDNEEDREEFYYHMKAGAESGWDYSTRWMIDSAVSSVADSHKKGKKQQETPCSLPLGPGQGWTSPHQDQLHRASGPELHHAHELHVAGRVLLAAGRRREVGSVPGQGGLTPEGHPERPVGGRGEHVVRLRLLELGNIQENSC